MNSIPKKSERSVRFLHISDTHLWPPGKWLPFGVHGYHPSAWQAIWQAIDNYEVDGVLWSGDVASVSKSDAYELSMSPQGPLLSPARVQMTVNGKKVYSVPGNHDYLDAAFWGRLAYRIRSQRVFAQYFQPMPGPDVHLFKADDLTIVIFRVDSSSGDVQKADYSKGKIHKSDIGQIDSWRKFAINGGHIEGSFLNPDDLLNSWNILLIHHELVKEPYHRAIDGDDKNSLLKFIAALPIHIVACGHLHKQNVSPFYLFQRGHLNKRHRANLFKKRLLRTDHVLVSRSGTACCTDSKEYNACILEFTASEVSVFKLIYENNSFSLKGSPIRKPRWTR